MLSIFIFQGRGAEARKASLAILIRCFPMLYLWMVFYSRKGPLMISKNLVFKQHVTVVYYVSCSLDNR